MPLNDDCQFYRENKSLLSRLYYGLWAVIKDRTIIGLFPISTDALRFAEEQFGLGVAAVVEFDEMPTDFGCKQDAVRFWKAFGCSRNRNHGQG